MEPANKPTYVFDDFCLDATACQLKRQGEAIPLPPKVFDVLLVMVENRGRILDKEFLHRTLWPDTFVEDGTLAQYVFLLRKALQEDTANHRYIETVPRRGYRFVAPVQEVTAGPRVSENQQNGHRNGHGETPAVTLPPPASGWALRWLQSRWTVGLVSLLLALGAAGLYFLLNRPSALLPATHSMQITKLTTMGKAVLPALSPDAKYVAFVLDDAGKQSVWVRQLAAANNVQVIAPAAVDYGGLTFSPDGNYLYYQVYNRPATFGTLYRLPVLGGAPTQLIDDIDSPVSFSPDGRRLAFLRYAPVKGESYLILADANGTGQQTLATRKSPDFFDALEGVAWSPDGKTLACAGRGTNANGPYMNLLGLNSTDGKEVVLTSRPWKQIGQMVWRRDSNGLLALARSQESPLSTSQLWYFPFPSGAPVRITNDLNLYSKLSANSDLSKLVTIQSSRVSSLWLAPVGETVQAVQLGGASMDNYAHKLGLTWAANGQLIYGSYASGNADLWVMDADGNNARQLTVDPNIDFAPAVAQSNNAPSFIAFGSTRGGGYSIWRMDRDGQNVRRLTPGQSDYYPTVTPDGKWVLYTADSANLPMTWKVAAEGGESHPFLPQSAFNPAVSPDGKWVALFYAVPEQFVYKLALVPITGGAPNRIFEVVSQDLTTVARWSADGQMITYIDTKNGVSNIWGQPIDGSPARQLTQFKSDLIFRFAWAPDGKTLACERGFYVNDVVLLSDFLPT
ncbi:MAG: winged helix-turn-helix domain-containing protein [Blastocatellia bacterium]